MDNLGSVRYRLFFNYLRSCSRAVYFVFATMVLFALLCGCGETIISLNSTAETQTPYSQPGTIAKIHKVVSVFPSSYTPDEIRIKLGETVTWVNQDSITRTITSWHEYQTKDGWVYTEIGKIWDSGEIRPGESFSRTFDEVGTFEYLSLPLYLFNSFHRGPVGSVIVTE